ncbi:hypothetical protein [Paenibacillus hamazuiensis]|uniref:hypothetical protein n=1 Tax=Paenibacillus hamazuiensis TaxID=2936508 RepID=UPI00200CAE1A|nr:hypothetical protein [Paenibacillus hamazuiensis]
MNFLLALFGGLIGLFVTGAAVFMAWLYLQHRKQPETSAYEPPVLLKWTSFDYALIILFLIGSLFLFTDALAVIRDRESYPLYHYGYLLCGFVFTFLGMLFMVVRLALVLSMVRSGSLRAPNHHNHPGDADQPE